MFCSSRHQRPYSNLSTSEAVQYWCIMGVSPVGLVETDLATQRPGHQKRTVRRKLAGDDYTPVTDVRHYLVQLDRRHREVLRPVTQLAAVRIEGQQPNAVAERRRYNPSADTERDLFNVAAADVRFGDVVGKTSGSKQ